MALGSALQKIRARVKVLRKRHPGAKFRTLQKQAGKEFKAGKLKARRSPGKKSRPVKRRKRRASVKRVTRVRTRRVTVYKTRYRTRAKKRTVRRRRVSGIMGMSKNTGMLVIAGIALLGVFLIMKNRTPPLMIPSGNMQVANNASQAIAIAQAAGATAAAVAKMIAQFNASNDAQATQLASSITADPGSYM